MRGAAQAGLVGMGLPLTLMGTLVGTLKPHSGSLEFTRLLQSGPL